MHFSASECRFILGGYMPYTKEHAVRVREPEEFIEDSFRSKEIADGIRLIVGKLKGGDTMTTQAIRFDAEKYTIDDVKKWVKEHNIDYIKIEEAVEKEQEITEDEEQEILVLPYGKYFLQGEWIEFTGEMLDEMIQNYNNENLVKPFIDRNHEKKESYGDILELKKSKEGLKARIQLNTAGKELIKDRQYRYISPWFGSFTDPQGFEHQYVLFSISLTNIPALQMLPELQEQMALEILLGINNKEKEKMEKIKEIYAKIKNSGKIKFDFEFEGEEDYDQKVSDLLNVLYEQLLGLSDLASQVDSLMAEK